jgi:sulfite reductase (ferredoxin)
MACTGIEFCKLAIVETKAAAARTIEHLERTVGHIDGSISINVNGCPNACARTQIGDIGLKGQLVRNAAGEMVEGFQVHLGGGLTMAHGQSANFGRKLRGLKTTAEELPAYAERLANRYLAGRKDAEEPFAEWVLRVDEEELR